MGIFKSCACGHTYPTREDFILRTTYVCDTSDMGLAMRNCACGSTLAMESEELYPERRDEFMQLWHSDPKYWLVLKVRRRKHANKDQS